MESSEHIWANISETICPKLLIFGEQASWTLFFQNSLTNPIISQISFSMTSHFGTLLVQNKLNSANRKQLDNYFKEFTTFSTIINFIFFVHYLSYYSTPIKRKIVFKQFKGEFCKIKTIQSYHLRGSDSFFSSGK